MEIGYEKQKAWLKAPRTTLLGVAFLVVALLALACAPAEEPTATTAPSAGEPETTVMEGEAAEEEELVSAEFIPSEEGRFVERAGLQIFIPKGYVAGGPLIPADPREPRYGGLFTVAEVYDPPSLDPYHTTASGMYAKNGHVYERLIHYPMGPGTDIYGSELIPGLAESWEWSDDFKELTFTLRKGVKWQNVAPVNGREFTSEDVVYTMNLYKEPESILKGRYDGVDRVEAPDRYTVVFYMKDVDLSVVDTLSTIPRGYIIPKEGNDFNRRLRSIGTGPYIMAQDYEYKLGVSFRRNPDYWLKDEQGNQYPYMDSMKMVIIPDAASRVAAFRANKIERGVALPSPQAARDMLRTNPNTIIQEYVGVQSLVGVGMRLDKEPFNDVRVRRALSLAIDYEEWAQTLYEIPASPAVTVNGFFTGEPNNLENYGEWYQGPDVERAKALLAEAGYPDGFSIKTEYFVYNPSHTETHELLQAYWKTIGVTTEILPLDYPIFRANLDKGAWTDISGWAFIVPFPSDMDSLVKPLVPGGPQNSNQGWVNDPELTRLVGEFRASYKDAAKRLDLLTQIRRRTLDQVFQIPWQYGHLFSAVQPWVRNYQPSNNATHSEGTRNTMTAWIDDAWK